MSKLIRIVGDSYKNLKITVDGVEIPCISAEIRIDHEIGVVANLLVPAEVDLIPITIGVDKLPEARYALSMSEQPLSPASDQEIARRLDVWRAELLAVMQAFDDLANPLAEVQLRGLAELRARITDGDELRLYLRTRSDASINGLLRDVAAFGSTPR